MLFIKMRNTIYIVLSLFLLMMTMATGCQNKTTAIQDTLLSDTLVIDSLPVDSIAEVIEEEPMPASADELFDDFFFNFAANRKLQKERILFPLTINSFGKTREIQAQEWRRERFFMRQGYYTLIFNTYEQTALVKDTTVADVTVERFSPNRNTVTRWHFLRTGGLWRMNNITHLPLSQHPDAGFISFYEKFATDSVFQQEALCDPVKFSGPDPDDDFSTMTGELMPEQWPMFAPWLPSGTLYNIVYGEEAYPRTNFRVFFMRGISNGMQTELQFVKLNGQWKLRKCTM